MGSEQTILPFAQETPCGAQDAWWPNTVSRLSGTVVFLVLFQASFSGSLYSTCLMIWKFARYFSVSLCNSVS